MEIYDNKRVRRSDLSLALFSPGGVVQSPFGEGVVIGVERLLTEGEFLVQVRIEGDFIYFPVEVYP